MPGAGSGKKGLKKSDGESSGRNGTPKKGGKGEVSAFRVVHTES
jgi:hypothetical protein